MAAVLGTMKFVPCCKRLAGAGRGLLVCRGGLGLGSVMRCFAFLGFGTHPERHGG